MARPSVTDLEVEYVTDAARHGWYERWHEYPSRFERAFAEYLGVPYAISYLGARGIESRPFFYPLSSMPAFAGLPSTAVAREENRVAYDPSARGVNLPSSLSLTHEQVGRVCDSLDSLLTGRGRGGEEFAGPALADVTGARSSAGRG